LVAKWSRPISGLSLTDLRAYLQRPLAEDEKIPIPQRRFDRLSKHPFLAESPELALSHEQVATLFRISTDEWAEDAEALFACAIDSVPPASGTKDLFHATWDNNILRILRFILSNAKPIRNSNDNTRTALKWPDYGLLINNHGVLRGEERSSDGAGDPERDLVNKCIWSYDPLPYILGSLWILWSSKVFLFIYYRISRKGHGRPVCCNSSRTLDNYPSLLPRPPIQEGES
jgi:hypothetical protein